MNHFGPFDPRSKRGDIGWTRHADRRRGRREYRRLTRTVVFAVVVKFGAVVKSVQLAHHTKIVTIIGFPQINHELEGIRIEHQLSQGRLQNGLTTCLTKHGTSHGGCTHGANVNNSNMAQGVVQTLYLGKCIQLIFLQYVFS